MDLGNYLRLKWLNILWIRIMLTNNKTMEIYVEIIIVLLVIIRVKEILTGSA